MTKRIFHSTLLVALAVLVSSLGIILGYLYNYFNGQQLEQLWDELSLAVTGTELGGMDYLRAVDTDRFRITWVAADGTVLYDTRADETAMENHADREEIRQALESGTGTSSRESATLTERTLYAAQVLSDGTVLRVSVSHATSVVLMVRSLQPALVVAALALALCAVLARHEAERIVRPLNRLDLEHPLENDIYDEISPLLRRINQQHRQIAAQMRQLQRKSDEFAQITDNLNEGLVLLNRNRKIISINPAARRLFGADDDCRGQDFLTLDRSTQVCTALDTAFAFGTCDIRVSRKGKEYQFNFSRILSDSRIVGTAILTFDITEQMSAERSRREFSANVSHELKTPLQSITGSAELLENGLVRPEDVPRFAGHIHREASRLVALIEDIIRLSQLDEGGELPRETVDLRALADEVAATLRPAADKTQVSITVTGQASFEGVRRLLQEILYNLCDNAVKYNVPGGTVEVALAETQAEVSLRVKDTGAGIPEEHQSRVFERFYRVDKSHSRQSGGTGLGLSIVKHAAACHRGKITLESAPGAGTTITIVFPK